MVSLVVDEQDVMQNLRIVWLTLGFLLDSMISGIAIAWTTVGFWKPALERALAVAGDNPAASKVSTVVTVLHFYSHYTDTVITHPFFTVTLLMNITISM